MSLISSLYCILKMSFKVQENKMQHLWKHSLTQNCLLQFRQNILLYIQMIKVDPETYQKKVLNNAKEFTERTWMIAEGLIAYNKTIFSQTPSNSCSSSSHTKNCIKGNDIRQTENITLQNSLQTNENLKNFKSQGPIAKNRPNQLTETSKESKVPHTRLGRLLSFGSLAGRVTAGAITEIAKQKFNPSNSLSISYLDKNPFFSPANAERIVKTICRVRGSALKLGQMLSIQDNEFISPRLQEIFERVRQSADFMPLSQVEKTMKAEFGYKWRDNFQYFENQPFAAASIGQVHFAKLQNGRNVAVKIQYPGVANSIQSDIKNLASILRFWNIFPKGLYIDNLLRVASVELSWEVDYEREAESARKFRSVLQQYPEYYVPEVINELSKTCVFTTELVEGVPIDKCVHFDQNIRNYIGKLILHLCLIELFQMQYMQTDPNWSNFLFNQCTQQLVLLDFGSSREFSHIFVNNYINLIKAASVKDHDRVLNFAYKMGFLTGYESKVMQNAFVNAVNTLGEPFAYSKAFDFGKQNTTHTIQNLIPIMINHRLCPPPDESYSLHRKLSGAFLICAKLKSQINCKNLFDFMLNNYGLKE